MAVELMTEKKKRSMGIVSFIPLVTLACVVVYHLFLVNRQAADGNSPLVATNETAYHVNTLTWLYAIAGAIAMAVFIYLVIHLLKLKKMTPGSKAVWVVVLAGLAPLSFPLFWWLHIKREPRKLEVKQDINE